MLSRFGKIKMRLPWGTLLIVLLLKTSLAFAGNSLYTLQLEAVDRSQAVRSQLLRTAFSQVLVQVSGSEAILATRQYAREQRNIDNYVQLYEYINIDTALQLSVQFNKTRLDQLLTKAAIAVWSDNRPVTVLWLHENEHSSSISSKLMQYAKQRGILLVTPLLDAQDQQLITREDIRELQATNIAMATKRYNSTVSLAGKVGYLDAQWQGNWLFIIGDQQYSYQATSIDLDALLLEAIKYFAKKLSLDYANHKYLYGSAVNKIKITVNNIVSSAEQVKVVNFLRQLPQVNNLEILQLSANGVDFLLQTIADYDNIKSNIAVSQLFAIDGANLRSQRLILRLL